MARDRIVGTATRYGLCVPRIEYRWERAFSCPSRPVRRVNGRGVVLTTHHLLAPRLRMGWSYTSASPLQHRHVMRWPLTLRAASMLFPCKVRKTTYVTIFSIIYDSCSNTKKIIIGNYKCNYSPKHNYNVFDSSIIQWRCFNHNSVYYRLTCHDSPTGEFWTWQSWCNSVCWRCSTEGPEMKTWNCRSQKHWTLSGCEPRTYHKCLAPYSCDRLLGIRIV
jgi:hypothetical protein